MKKRLSLTRLLHNDKIMMMVSAVLAVLIWALVVYGPSNTEEQVISGVPIAVTLNDYASQTLNLRIADGTPPTATVRVRGLRSVVSRLSATDITVTADTGNVIKEGTYTLPLRAVSNGDYTIQSVVGPDGNNDTVTISCDVWREAYLPVTVEMPQLTVTDEKLYQIGTPVVNTAVLRDGLLTLYGPRSDISRVNTVVAVIAEKQALKESAVFTATLEARDASGNVISTIHFLHAEDGKVSVTVPILVYRELALSPTLMHVPAGYQSAANLVSVKPSKLAVWGVPSELDNYMVALQEQLTVDFDRINGDALTRTIVLEKKDGIRPVTDDEKILLSINLSNISKQRFDLAVDSSSVSFANLAMDMTASVKQTTLSVTLCGPASALESLSTSNLRVQADLSQLTVGLQTVPARVTVTGVDTVWAYYGDGKSGADLLVSIDKK